MLLCETFIGYNSNVEPSLYGIVNSNRDFTKEESWGKNQFNSSFPAALACYMYSKQLNLVYLTLGSDLNVKHSFISVDQLFGLKPDSPDLYFSFESDYPPFRQFVTGTLPRIDLVTMNSSSSASLKMIEIKLTALPDNTTCKLTHEDFSCEIVVRPDSIIYLALSIVACYKDDISVLHNLMSDSCGKILEWNDFDSLKGYLSEMVASIDKALLRVLTKQTALVMQPVWKTNGKSIQLAENCLDIFVWSNFAFTRLFVDQAKFDLQRDIFKVSRHMRTVIWLARMLYDFSHHGKINYANIIDEVSLNTKNDKAFALISIGAFRLDNFQSRPAVGYAGKRCASQTTS